MPCIVVAVAPMNPMSTLHRSQQSSCTCLRVGTSSQPPLRAYVRRRHGHMLGQCPGRRALTLRLRAVLLLPWPPQKTGPLASGLCAGVSRCKCPAASNDTRTWASVLKLGAWLSQGVLDTDLTALCSAGPARARGKAFQETSGGWKLENSAFRTWTVAAAAAPAPVSNISKVEVYLPLPNHASNSYDNGLRRSTMACSCQLRRFSYHQLSSSRLGAQPRQAALLGIGRAAS